MKNDFCVSTRTILLTALVLHFAYQLAHAQLTTAGNQFWHSGISGIESTGFPGEGFATSLASGDFNGDGYQDLAVGIPYDLGTISTDRFGSVEVIYGSATGLTATADQYLEQDSTGIIGTGENGDEFGNTLAVGDFDGDGFDDLAIGVVGEDVGTLTNAGAVNVLYGSPFGLGSSGNQEWDQNSPGITNTAEAYDEFGYSLSTGDYDGDGYDDLAIGVPLEKRNGEDESGAVHVLYGSNSGLTKTGSQLWAQDSSGMSGLLEENDRFGWSLASGDFDGNGFDDLAIGSPYENISSGNDEGAVNIIYGSSSGLKSTGNQLWAQSSGILGASEAEDLFGYSLAAGDFDGDGRDDLAIGVPQEDLGSIIGTGAVNVLYGSSSTGLSATGNQLWTQNSGGILDQAESGDDIAYQLAVGDFDNDGRDDLVIGAKFEDIGSLSSPGAVNIIYGANSSGLASARNQLWTQNSSGILDQAEVSEYFGSSLTTGDYNGDGLDDLAIGVPFEDDAADNAGAANVLYGKKLRSSSTGFWTEMKSSWALPFIDPD